MGASNAKYDLIPFCLSFKSLSIRLPLENNNTRNQFSNCSFILWHLYERFLSNQRCYQPLASFNVSQFGILKNEMPMLFNNNMNTFFFIHSCCYDRQALKHFSFQSIMSLIRTSKLHGIETNNGVDNKTKLHCNLLRFRYIPNWNFQYNKLIFFLLDFLRASREFRKPSSFESCLLIDRNIEYKLTFDLKAISKVVIICITLYLLDQQKDTKTSGKLRMVDFLQNLLRNVQNFEMRITKNKPASSMNLVTVLQNRNSKKRRCIFYASSIFIAKFYMVRHLVGCHFSF